MRRCTRVTPHRCTLARQATTDEQDREDGRALRELLAVLPKSAWLELTVIPAPGRPTMFVPVIVLGATAGRRKSTVRPMSENTLTAAAAACRKALEGR